MAEIEARERVRVDPLLRPDQLQLVARTLRQLGAGLGADADPVDPGRRGQRAVGLHRDFEAARVERVDQRRVELEHRLAAGDHDQRAFAPGPQRRHLVRQFARRIAPAILAIHADEIGVAERALRVRTVLLAPAPQIAAGEPEKHRPPPRLHAFALEGQEDFLDRICHSGTPLGGEVSIWFTRRREGAKGL